MRVCVCVRVCEFVCECVWEWLLLFETVVDIRNNAKVNNAILKFPLLTLKTTSLKSMVQFWKFPGFSTSQNFRSTTQTVLANKAAWIKAGYKYLNTGQYTVLTRKIN